MKIIIYILCFIVQISVYAQDQKKIFSKQQLDEDLEYLFKSINQIHPNLYNYKSFEYIESFKQTIRDQITSPMTKNDFNKIVSEINHCFDGHTFVFLDFFNQEVKLPIYLFPKVTLSDNKIILMKDNSPIEIRSINGLKVDDITSKLRLYFTQEQISIAHKTYEHMFASFLKLYFHLESPFQIEGIANGKTITWVEQGIIHQKNDKRPKYQYKIFPNDSIALLELNTFDIEKTEFEPMLSTFFDSIQNKKIKHLFIDLTHNSGGKIPTSLLIFDYIKHDSIFLTSEEAIKVSPQFCEYMHSINNNALECSENTYGKIFWIPMKKRVLSDPQPTGYSGQIYLLQGFKTYSAADYVCRIVAQNNLGKRIGEPSGEPIKHYSRILHYYMPHTRLQFYCASTYLNIPTSTQANNTLLPDIFYPIDSFTSIDINVLRQLLLQIP